MQTLNCYYVIDPLAEKIIGNFVAISDEMAKFIFKKSILENEKLKSMYSQLHVYMAKDPIIEYETANEVFDLCIMRDFSDVKVDDK